MTHPAESVRAECPVEHPLLLRLALLCGECHFQPVQGIPWQRKTGNWRHRLFRFSATPPA
jgi:hypothetical protein